MARGYNVGSPLGAYAQILSAPIQAQSRKDVADVMTQGRLEGIGMQQQGADRRAMLNSRTRFGLKEMDLDFQGEKLDREMEARWADLNVKAQHYKNMDMLGLMDINLKTKNQERLEIETAFNMKMDEDKARREWAKYGLDVQELPYKLQESQARAEKLMSDLGLNRARVLEIKSKIDLNAVRAEKGMAETSNIRSMQRYRDEVQTPLGIAQTEKAGQEALFTGLKRQAYLPIEQSKMDQRAASEGYFKARTAYVKPLAESQMAYNEGRLKLGEAGLRQRGVKYGLDIRQRRAEFLTKEGIAQAQAKEKLIKSEYDNIVRAYTFDKLGNFADQMNAFLKDNQGKTLEIRDASGKPAGLKIGTMYDVFWYFAKMSADSIEREGGQYSPANIYGSYFEDEE